MKPLRPALLALLALGVVLLIPPAARAEPVRRAVVNRIVAVVGRDVITLVELRRRARPYLAKLEGADKASRPAAEAQMYKELVGRIVEDRLIDMRARSLSITVDAAEIDRALEVVAKAQGMTPEELLAGASTMGLSEADYREALRVELMCGKLVRLRLADKPKGQDAQSPAEMERAVEEARRALLDELKREVFIEVRL